MRFVIKRAQQLAVSLWLMPTAQTVRRLAIVAVFTLVAVAAPTVHAITTDELNAIVSTPMYDPTSNDCSTTPGTSTATQPAATAVQGNKVFYIGDSLTFHMVKGSSDPAKYATSSGKLLEKTKAAGFDVDVTIPPVGGKDSSDGAPRIIGHSVEAQGGIAVAGSIQHLDEHPTDFDKDHANIVVIGLGTNRETNETNSNTDTILGPQIDALIAKIRTNNSPTIYWVNGYWTTPPSVKSVTWQAVNATLAQASARDNFHILDYAAAAQADPSIAPSQYVSGGADGIHVDTVEGREKKADWIISQLPKAGTAVPAAPSPLTNPVGGYDPTSLSYPAFPDEAAIATGIYNYIKSKKPNSPWLTMPGVNEAVGTWIMAEAKTRNINPLFVVASGSDESGFGTTGDAPKVNNFFGMKNSSPPPPYIPFATPQLGIQAFMDAIKRNTQSGTSRYSQAKNIYEYFSIHQTGSIVYPGDDFDPRDVDTKPGITKDLYDPSMNVWISWDPQRNADNPDPNHRGQYTPLGYYKNNIAVINGVTGLNLPSDNPSRSGTTAPTNTACGGSTAAGQGAIDVSGYAFPLAPQTRAIGGIKVGQTTTTHHDGTAAFDLLSPDDSAEVYAIYGGTPVDVNTNFRNDPGCTSIQFKADDGFYYWYGHLKEPTVAKGVHIPAGTPMAKVADPVHFTAACWEGTPHLHIDRGCVLNGVPQTGGVKECRDPNFIPLLSKIYEGLPQ